MKKIYSFKIRLLIFLMLVDVLLGFVPNSYAQSIQNWSEPINLSKSGAASQPSMVVDGQGILHVLWVDEFDGYKYAQSVDGLTWTSPETIKFPFSTKDSPPVLLTDTKGLIHIFWLSDENELSYAQTLGENLDAPSAWRTVVAVGTSVFDFDANIDGQGRLHIGYVKNPAPDAETAGVFYRRSSDGGFTWSAAVLLYESPYFRSLTTEDARIRIAVSEKPDEEKVYAVWDDRPQKRIFMAISSDGGLKWDVVKEIITPQENLGFRTPYHADVDILENKVLVAWQVGEPGVRCTPFSWASYDGGETWDEEVKIFGESAECPEGSEFIHIAPGYSVSLFTIQGDLAINAWDGSRWSDPEIQTGPSLITNPSTFDTVLLDCKQATSYNNRLFVVGCDRGAGGDIWFIERQLEPMANLFPLPSAWTGDVNVATVSQFITSLSSITDGTNNIHVLWVQSSLSTDAVEPRIEYARWNGKEWTKPTPVITDLNGLPLNLSLKIDSHQRLLLSWVDQQTGELLFAWANSERANIPLEWTKPVVLQSSSKLTNSPDMLVDSSDRIMIAYAITLNEERGIYVTQSTDLGETWSSPVKVFDAVSVNWEMVDQPRLALTEDGRLHILFTQYRLLGIQQPTGLYYSQSVDGGITWTTPEIVSEQAVQWSEIIAYKKMLHRFWQEKSKAVVSTYHQTLSDSGATWNSPAKIQGDAGIISMPSVSSDWTGKIHLLQITQDDTQTLQEWEWDEGRWQLLETRKLSLPEQKYPLSLGGGITSQRIIYALLQIEVPLLNEEAETSLLNISRSLEPAIAAQPFLASISTPSASFSTATPDFQPILTEISPLANLEDTQSPIIKNIVGLILIAAVVFLLLIFMLPRRSKANDETKRSK